MLDDGTVSNSKHERPVVPSSFHTFINTARVNADAAAYIPTTRTRKMVGNAEGRNSRKGNLVL